MAVALFFGKWHTSVVEIRIITVRPIRDEEYEAAAQVIRSSILSHLDAEGISLEIIEYILLKYDAVSLREKFLQSNLYIALLNGELVGVAGLIEGTTEVYNRISTLFISPQALGKGVGKAIIAELAQRVSSEGAHSLEVFARVNAEGFYTKQGFSRVNSVDLTQNDEKKKYTVWMEKVW